MKYCLAPKNIRSETAISFLASTPIQWSWLWLLKLTIGEAPMTCCSVGLDTKTGEFNARGGLRIGKLILHPDTMHWWPSNNAFFFYVFNMPHSEAHKIAPWKVGSQVINPKYIQIAKGALHAKRPQIRSLPGGCKTFLRPFITSKECLVTVGASLNSSLFR